MLIGSEQIFELWSIFRSDISFNMGGKHESSQTAKSSDGDEFVELFWSDNESEPIICQGF